MSARDTTVSVLELVTGLCPKDNVLGFATVSFITSVKDV